MAKIIKDGRMLDPVLYGDIPMARRTKGTPFTNGGTGFNLNLNKLPPGMDATNQETAMELKRVYSMQPMGPILK